MTRILRLEGVLHDYEWGDPNVLPDLLGLERSGDPHAEWWLGAHPRGSSPIVGRDDALGQLVAADPVGMLGPTLAERFGELPFLAKVLTAAAPLSIQAHPSMEQARQGFAAEEEAGIPIDAPNRVFRDDRHKPELICALTTFEAICGFALPSEILRRLDALELEARELDALGQLRRALAGEGSDAQRIRAALDLVLRMPEHEGTHLARDVTEAASELGAPFERIARNIRALAAAHEGDIGIVIALLMRHLDLEPGEALFLGPGNLHAYLRGAGVEVMANSDNVLRGGLTVKHRDVDGLMAILDTSPADTEVQRPTGSMTVYNSPVEEFSLARFEDHPDPFTVSGPAVVLVTEGEVVVDGTLLTRGQAAFVPGSDSVSARITATPGLAWVCSTPVS